MMGLLVMREGEYAASIRLLKRALTREPDMKAAHCLLAKAYIALGQRSRAMRHLRQVLEADPADEWAQRLLFGPACQKKPPKKRKYCMQPTRDPRSRQVCMAIPLGARK